MEDVISRYMKDVVNRDYPRRNGLHEPEECKTFATDMKWERKLEELQSAQKKSA